MLVLLALLATLALIPATYFLGVGMGRLTNRLDRALEPPPDHRHRLCLANTAALEHALMPPPYDHEGCRRCAVDRLYARRPQPVDAAVDDEEHVIRAWGEPGVLRVSGGNVAAVRRALADGDKDRLLVLSREWEYLPLRPQARPEKFER